MLLAQFAFPADNMYLRDMAIYYRHFKGGVYRLLNIAKDSESQERVVVYQAMYGGGEIWTRPYDMFYGKVNRNGKEQDRFTPISEEEALSNVPIELNPKYHFPDIEYQVEMPTMLYPEGGFSKGVKAMVTLLKGNHLVSADFFDGLYNDDDIEKEAWRRITSYKDGDDLESIFHLIQTWGGSSGRGIYIFGGGFDWSNIREHYKKLVGDCLTTKDTSDESIEKLVQTAKEFNRSVRYLGISFITKHMRFWLFRPLGNDAFPIYDSVLANEVMMQKEVNDKHLFEYWKVMVAKAHQLGIGLMPLERQIFQYSLGTR